MSSWNPAFVEILEQPAQRSVRFRYKNEGRSTIIPGASSTEQNKTFPTIRVVGHKGKAIVVVSCVTKDEPHRPHPHALVGRKFCKNGVFTAEIPETMTLSFDNLNIQCVKKKEVEEALTLREQVRVDPFKTGFAHKSRNIDLNALRLCFQVYIPGQDGKYTVPLAPVVTQPIINKLSKTDLVIVELSHCTSYADGARHKILLFCEKVVRNDIQVRFFLDNWESFGQITRIHNKTGISFWPPPYQCLAITEPVRVGIQLRRPSDGATSQPLPFDYLPLESEPGVRKRKRLADQHLMMGRNISYGMGTLSFSLHNSFIGAPSSSRAPMMMNIPGPSTSRFNNDFNNVFGINDLQPIEIESGELELPNF